MRYDVGEALSTGDIPRPHECGHVAYARDEPGASHDDRTLRPHPAASLLALAPTPPGALTVSALPGKVFSQPAIHPACQPLNVRTAYWTSSLAGPMVMKYLMTHPGPQLLVNFSGSGRTIKGVVNNWEVSLDRKGETSGMHSVGGPPTLVYEIASLPRGVGIRVDAEVVPADAVCSRS